MKRPLIKLALCAALLTPFAVRASEVWHKADPANAPAKLQLIHPDHFLVYTLDEATIKLQLWNLSAIPEEGAIIALPMPDGSLRDFRVWETSMMPDALAARYPEIKTFTAEATDDATVTAKLDMTLHGFHAMVYNGENTAFIDPYDEYHDGLYMVHYKKDLAAPIDDRMHCGVHGTDENGPAGESMDMAGSTLPKLANKTINGYDLRTYNLALSANHFYCAAAPASATIATALSKMTTTMNRVNGVYEREFAVTMKFVANEDHLIWPTATGGTNGADPFNTINASAPSCMSQNQTECDTRIGSAGYDIGHVFTTGAGGQAALGSVCNGFDKAQGVTGSPTPVGDAFDIDYVAHEMGHQFGSSHTFNNNTDGSCATNAESTMAYEPGSGSTILAYAGICTPDDVQAHSDAYFHVISLEKIQAYITGSGDCAVKTPTGNKLVKYDAFTKTYTIPYLTPFELTGPKLTDTLTDSVTLYCWEEFDLGSFGSRFANTTDPGPIFRSYTPVKSATRVFPKISAVLVGNLNIGWEKAPTVARDLTFKCTFRNVRNGKGCFTDPDDLVTLHAITTGTSSGFKVTSQGTTGITYAGGSTQTVTWSVLNTAIAPISATNVDIYMSTNGGNSWQYVVGTFPNTGTATVTVPNPSASSTTVRFKVKGNGNVFFNVNSTNFAVTHNASLPVSPNGVQQVASAENDLRVFPVPASDMLHIASGSQVKAAIYNTVGQQVWAGTVSGTEDIDVASWARGMYFVRTADVATGASAARSIIIE